MYNIHSANCHFQQHNDHNCSSNHCHDDNFNYNNSFSQRRRYIFPLNTINATNTTEIDLSSLFTAALKFNCYESTANEATFMALPDTGSNTPALKTEFVKKQSFPIYCVKRLFTADTANGTVIIQYATVLELENVNDDGDKYWMKTIFHLLDELTVDIIVDRRLMRLLG